MITARQLATRLELRTSLAPARVVRLSFVFSSLLLLVFVVKHVSRVPIHDEYSNVIFLFAEPPVPWHKYWEQHNEHRIPVPRLLYIAAVRLAGNDFRAPPILNALMLCAATGFLLRSIRQIRGEYVLSDAAVPLGLLTIGQYGNLLWGFQVQFLASVSLLIVAFALAIGPGLAASRSRLAGIALCGILMTGCGANGVVFAPGMALALLVIGGWNLRRGEHRGAGLTAIVSGVALLFVVGKYFHGLQPVAHHEKGQAGLAETTIAGLNLLGMAFGPVARWLQPQPYDGPTILGGLALTLVIATAALLIRVVPRREQTDRAVMIGGLLVGFLGLAAGIAKSRAGLINVLDVNRYYTLMLPMMAGVYIAWSVFGSRRVAQLIALAIAAAAVPNAIVGWREGKPFTYYPHLIEYGIGSGMPLEFVADRYPYLYPFEPQHRRDMLAMLAKNGAEPFRSATPLPKLREEPVPLSAVQAGLKTVSRTRFVTEDTDHITFAWPSRKVYGIRLTYRMRAAHGNTVPTVLSWEKNGGPPRSQGSLFQLEVLDDPTDTLIFAQGELDSLRIDLFGRDSSITVHGVTLLIADE
jgi:hypothetical protein